MIFEILKDNGVKNKNIIDVSSKGSFEKAKFVKDLKIDTVICLGIENWIFHYLTGFGIDVFAGIEGNIDIIINRLLTGRLQHRPFPIYSFKVIPRGRYRRGMKGHRWFYDGHFNHRFM